MLNIRPENITLIGDSAGGNLCAALSLMARDRGEFMPNRQILIYPATYNDYTENSPFVSVKENGSDYLLTAAYGERLKEAGNHVEIHRIKDALHGYFALGIKQLHVQESFTYINEFLKGETQ